MAVPFIISALSKYVYYLLQIHTQKHNLFQDSQCHISLVTCANKCKMLKMLTKTQLFAFFASPFFVPFHSIITKWNAFCEEIGVFLETETSLANNTICITNSKVY